MIFEEKAQKEIPDTDLAELYAKIGKLEIEKIFLKEKLIKVRFMIDLEFYLSKILNYPAIM
ncbi:hypothetical protein Q73A0000_09465 [Kaistella flava (ex Peng et al. 2021)]|uniref:PWI domain-containing protein n=1 Tax=Kaistella flava (ex Peng et al. 2021) TaxID=2038776 RepID=A0A7M2YAB9_9FLAO|nr:hypothetical protein [Kaistella flava (ex Peng et al. 2021)]QOW10585.1 hypothetical protein Q73A0000_09465 [Kaistella flava (ex Peng et al. 2021)]